MGQGYFRRVPETRTTPAFPLRAAWHLLFTFSIIAPPERLCLNKYTKPHSLSSPLCRRGKSVFRSWLLFRHLLSNGNWYLGHLKYLWWLHAALWLAMAVHLCKLSVMIAKRYTFISFLMGSREPVALDFTSNICP